jgi:small GTP-binding protein
MMQAAARNALRKVVLVGDSGGGKTSIASFYAKSSAPIKPTITANSLHCTERIDGREVHFELWDTAGQESYKCLVPVYARGAVFALVVFDRSSRDSFENLGSWAEFLKSDVEIENFLVVGNKSDLAPAVTTQEASDWARLMSADYVETSAKTGANIRLLFQMVARRVVAAEGEKRSWQANAERMELVADAAERKSCEC